MKVTATLLLLLIGTLSYSQSYITYHNTCNSACELMVNGEYQEAVDSITKAISLIDEPIAIDLFNLAKCYSQLNNKDSCLYYLESSLKLQNLKYKLEKNSLWFEPILGLKKWNEVKGNTYYKLPKIEIWQKELIVKLEQLTSLDQYYRNILYDSIKVYHFEDTLLTNLYWDSVEINDILVHNELEKIIYKFGWPGFKMTGHRKTLASVFLLHSSDSWFKKMDSILIKEIELGNLHPNTYAQIADRIRLRNKLKPLYNGYSAFNNKIDEEIITNCKKIGRTLPQLQKHR